MIALVFPGQGSQAVGMGKELADAHPEAQDVFARADGALGGGLSTLCFDGPEAALRLTANTQPAILATSIACLEVLRKALPGLAPRLVAGHSLGEYSALVAAGSMTLEDAVRTVRARGTFMQEAVPEGMGAMAALLGMERDAVPALLAEAAGGEVLEAANFNGPGQVVIAGAAGAVGRAIELAKGRGAKKAVALPVSAPFHCSLMAPAAARLAPVLGALDLHEAAVPVVRNVDAREVRAPDELREGLARQVASAVLWEDSVMRMWEAGIRTFVEIGPGRVLSGLVKRIVPGAAGEFRIWNVEDAKSLEKTVASITAASTPPMGGV